jgi:uncharacterized membrane protein
MEMIEVHDNPARSGSVVIETRSNLSITLDRLATVFLGLSAVTLLVALGPLILGLWPILLIAVIHLLIVGWCFRLAWRGNWARETIEIGKESLIVEHYDLRRRSSNRWPVAWVRVRVEPSRLGDVRVYLECQGQSQQLGAFLPVSERLELAEILKKSLRPFSAWGPGNQPQVS